MVALLRRLEGSSDLPCMFRTLSRRARPDKYHRGIVRISQSRWYSRRFRADNRSMLDCWFRLLWDSLFRLDKVGMTSCSLPRCLDCKYHDCTPLGSVANPLHQRRHSNHQTDTCGGTAYVSGDSFSLQGKGEQGTARVRRPWDRD